MQGQTLGHYKIVEKLGEGGMGEVYRAEDTKLGREVALKVLPQIFTADPERLARFEREARMLAALNHPSIASIYSFERAEAVGEGGQPVHFLVMELVGGETLGGKIRSGALPVAEVLPIARQIAEALEAAHERGIIHRDLKPGNVMVGEAGRVKVLDFGLAKALDTTVDASGIDAAAAPSMSPTLTAAMTGANVLLGTAAYMSPEQAKGKTVDKRADIWAFGVMVWEMLTGKRLFAGDSVTDTLADVLRAEIDLAQLAGKVPPPLLDVVRRCLERDADRRLHDIADARLVIDELVAGEWEPPAEVGERRASWLQLALAGLVGFAVGAVAIWMLAGPPPTPTPRASRFEIPIPDALGSEPALSPDGSTIVYTSEGQLWVRELDRIEARALIGGEGGFAPFWSPDARSIGFSADSAMWRVPIEGGSRTQLSEDSQGSSGTAVWMPDDRIVYTTGGSGILEVSAVGGQVKEVVPLSEDQADFHELSVLPDGKGFLTVVHKVDQQDFGNVTLITVDRQKELVAAPGEMIHTPIYSQSGHILYNQRGGGGINGIWAVPFSLDSLEVTGDPFVVARDAEEPNVSGSTLVYAPEFTAHVNELVWVDRTGRVLETVGEARKGLLPGISLSPDGHRALVTLYERQGFNDWIVDLESGQTTRVTFEEKTYISKSAWTPDGTRVAYLATSRLDDHRLMIKRADGSRDADLVTEAGFSLSFSPDERYLIFGRPRPGFLQDLWLRDLETGDESPFVQTDHWDTLATFSPDGRLVAYCSGRAIVVTRFPEADSEWQIAESGGFPVWSGDGSRLYFFDGDDLMQVAIDPGPPFRSSKPERLFTFRRAPMDFNWARSFAVDGNGERFLMVRTAGIPPGIVVFQNWLAGLEQ